MNFYFRTHISENTGIGNYMRCLRLALKLKKKNHKCTIFTDNKIKKNIFNKKIRHVHLYRNVKNKISELSDAKIFNTQTDKAGYVFIDDYRFGKYWQKKVKVKHQKIIVIDDFLNKKHNADILINTKPDFLIKSNYEKEILRNKNIKLLLGPKYVMIESKVIRKKKRRNSAFKIGFYFGGSSDLNISIKIIKNLIHKIDLKKIEINVIVGPYSKNKKKLFKLKNRHKKIKIIESPPNLSQKIKDFDMFIGSAGISLFETALYKVPSIIFVLNDNQKVDIGSLEKLGHYFVLKKEDLKEISKISDIILLFYKKRLRIKKLIMGREFNIDDKGSNRIIKEIFSKNQTTPQFELINKKIENEKKFKMKFTVEKTKDKSINHYRDIRNNLINRKFSLSNSTIKKVDHYNWWFQNSRVSYTFKKSNKILMFFFHDILKIKNYEFLIPGWYILNRKCSFLDIIMGIKHQYKILTSNNKFKNMTQIGIISKKNKTMIDLAPKLNWRLIEKNDAILEILKTKIKIKNFFNYYRR